MPPLRGVTSYTGLNVGGAAGGPAGSGLPVSTVSGGVYPSGQNIYAIAQVVVPVVATSVPNNASVQTTHTFSGATVGDALIATVGTSGLSASVTLEAWVNAADQVTIRYGNVSATTAAQIATNVSLLLIKTVA